MVECVALMPTLRMRPVVQWLLPSAYKTLADLARIARLQGSILMLRFLSLFAKAWSWLSSHCKMAAAAH